MKGADDLGLEPVRLPGRRHAYAAIDSERTYQDALPSTRTDGRQHTVGEFVAMLQHYQNELVRAWTMNAGDELSLHVMRKIAAIAVHCMEDHGAPRREHWSTFKPDGRDS